VDLAREIKGFCSLLTVKDTCLQPTFVCVMSFLEFLKTNQTVTKYKIYNYQSKHNKNYCIMFYNMFYNYMFRHFSLGHLQVVYTRT